YKGFRDGDESNSEFFESGFKYKLTENQNISLKYSRYEDKATSPRALKKSQLDNPESNGLFTKYDKLLENNVVKNEVNGRYDYKINEKVSLDLIA
ncbi:MAG: hypothetical protein RSC21_07065, partial [Cetobacterium sp.]